MPDTGAPWNIPYVAGTDLVADWPTDSQTLATAIADGLDAAGKIAQVVTVTKSDTFSTSSNSYTVVTGLSASITPTSASNKVLLLATVTGLLSSTTTVGFLSAFRGATNLSTATSPSNRIPTFASQILPSGANVPQNLDLYHISLVDSPATTSSTTYEVQVFASSGGTVYINRGITDTDTGTVGRGISTLTLLEVKG